MRRWIERQPRCRNPVWLKDQNINISSVRVGLVYGDSAPVWRETHVAVGPGRPSSAHRLSVSVKPSQLREGRAFSRLDDQNRAAGDAENCPVHEMGIQYLVAQGVWLAAQNSNDNVLYHSLSR